MNLLFAAIVLMGLADWTRGMPNNKRPKWLPKFVCLLTIGWCVAALAGHPFDLVGLAIAVLVAAGGTVGMGNALGPTIHGERPSKLGAEKWQVGPMLDNAWLSLAALGLIWGAPAALATFYFDPRVWVIPVAFAAATPLAAWLSIRSVGGSVRRVDGSDPDFHRETRRSNTAWTRFNASRSPLAGLFMLALTHEALYL